MAAIKNTNSRSQRKGPSQGWRLPAKELRGKNAAIRRGDMGAMDTPFNGTADAKKRDDKRWYGARKPRTP